MKRDIIRQFRFNKKENEMLKCKAEKCCLTDSALVRLLILGFQPKEKPDEEFYKVMRELYAIGNNLNQIASKANAIGFIDAPLLYEQLDKLSLFQKQVHERFIKPDKDSYLWQ